MKKAAAREALKRAADWLEANPDKHIVADCATDDAGDEVDPRSDNAVCFCAYGRFIRELGDAADEAWSNHSDRYTAVKREFGVGFAQVYEVNDGLTRGTDETGPNREVIPFLRKLAKEL